MLDSQLKLNLVNIVLYKEYHGNYHHSYIFICESIPRVCVTITKDQIQKSNIYKKIFYPTGLEPASSAPVASIRQILYF